MIVEDIEKRFIEVSGIECDLSKFPLNSKDIKNNIEIDKQKSNQYGEVFTPLWLVDKMILKATVEKLYLSKSTLDLCAGYGQFTIRMIRALYNYDKNFNVSNWLKENHTFIEIQLESAYKLLIIFGYDINLLIGDALKIDEVKNWNGVSIYKYYWKEIPLEWLQKNINKNEKYFINRIIIDFLNKGQNEGVVMRC